MEAVLGSEVAVWTNGIPKSLPFKMLLVAIIHHMKPKNITRPLNHGFKFTLYNYEKKTSILDYHHKVNNRYSAIKFNKDYE